MGPGAVHATCDSGLDRPLTAGRLLERLGVPFEVVRPAASEEHLACRGKCRATGPCACPGRERRKPWRRSGPRCHCHWQRPGGLTGQPGPGQAGRCGDCRGQLAALSGQTARFHTGCAVVANGERLVHLDTTLCAVPGPDTGRDQPLPSSARSLLIAPGDSRRKRWALTPV